MLYNKQLADCSHKNTTIYTSYVDIAIFEIQKRRFLSKKSSEDCTFAYNIALFKILKTTALATSHYYALAPCYERILM